MMETAATDRRIMRTREAIQVALIELIEEKGFEAIAIKDIADRANINRGTFYLHYHDKFDLLDQTEAGIIEHMKDILLESGKLSFEEYNNPEKIVPVIVSLFEYIKSRAKVMHAVLGLKANPGFQSRIKKAIETNLFNLGFFSKKSQEDLLVPLEYLVSYLSAAHMGVVQAWLTNDCRETPQEMAQILARMSFHGPFQAVRQTTTPD
jgi:AcrR family transcriptional regulator